MKGDSKICSLQSREESKKSTMAIGDSTGDSTWTLVTRRKPYPKHWSSSPAATNTTKTYQPYSTTPSYASVTYRNTLSTKPNYPKPNSNSVTPNSTRPSSPTSPKPSNFYISPHSPTTLRFPPSPHFTEWRNRCFKCCRHSHTSAVCRNPKRCGRCWGTGHIGTHCGKEALNPAAPPFLPPPKKDAQKPKPLRGEPSFDDFLSEPLVTKPLPEGRPEVAFCYIEKDEEYHVEMEKLQGAVVLETHHWEIEPSIDQVAKYAEKTNLVKIEELSISNLSSSRFLILLPHGLAPEVFIEAMPDHIWHLGITLSIWSPFDNAQIMVPKFKVLIDLLGIPPYLYRPTSVIRAVSTFGTNLGSVEQKNREDLSCWTVVVATDDLGKIPHKVAYVIGGFKTLVRVNPITWKHSALYKADEMPKQPPLFRPPPIETSNDSDKIVVREDELISMSRNDLREICKGLDFNILPESVKEMLAGSADNNGVIHNTTQRLVHVASQDPRPHQIGGSSPSQQQLVILTRPLYEAGHSPHIINSPYEVPVVVDEQNPLINSNIGESSPVINSRPSSHAKTAIPNPISPQNPPIIQNNSITTSLTAENQSQIVPITFSAQKPPPFIPAVNQNRGTTPKLSNVTQTYKKKGDLTQRKTPSFMQPKNKMLGRSRGASSSMGPERNVQLPKVSTRLKRKNQMLETGSSKPQCVKKHTQPKQRQHANLSKTADGFFEVRVDYDHCSRLAQAAGFKPDDVEMVIRDDNEERKNRVVEDETDMYNPELEMIDTRFDPDTDDDLGSESV